MEKLDIYDILGALVPGVVLVFILSCISPTLPAHITKGGYPSEFVAVVLVALSVVAGHVIQAVASLIAPVLHWTWGGYPSERALTKGLGKRYLPEDTALRIKKKLTAAVGDGASDRSLFRYAMQQAEGVGRTSRFNYLYTYHRSLFTLSLVATPCVVMSVRNATGGRWTWAVAVAALLVTGLLWHRAKQRAFHYVCEVLHAAESRLDERNANPRAPLAHLEPGSD